MGWGRQREIHSLRGLQLNYFSGPIEYKKTCTRGSNGSCLAMAHVLGRVELYWLLTTWNSYSETEPRGLLAEHGIELAVQTLKTYTKTGGSSKIQRSRNLSVSSIERSPLVVTNFVDAKLLALFSHTNCTDWTKPKTAGILELTTFSFLFFLFYFLLIYIFFQKAVIWTPFEICL